MAGAVEIALNGADQICRELTVSIKLCKTVTKMIRIYYSRNRL